MQLMILGCRGIPARHGGFETFTQDLARFLVARGHEVTVYCQVATDQKPSEDEWEGIHRVNIPAADNPLGTIQFDWTSNRHASGQPGVVLTLGYNTAVFGLLYRLHHVPNVINMDGIEWKRAKWSPPQRLWLCFNEWVGTRLGNHLVADHPEIANHLARHTPRRKITMIPYGADTVNEQSVAPLEQFGLRTKEYYILIARPEPENSLLEIVQGHVASGVSTPLLVLGDYTSQPNDYKRAVQQAAGANARFPGAIYDRKVLGALRFHARAYLHGHQVGGTNPSLVEALAAGNAIIAHDNRFSRWVAEDAALYFDGPEKLSEIFRTLENAPRELAELERNSTRRHQERFTQEKVLSAYEALLLEHESAARRVSVPGKLSKTPPLPVEFRSRELPSEPINHKLKRG
jgi:glycosyltransferase involved in cell wall biosynthesis